MDSPLAMDVVERMPSTTTFDTFVHDDGEGTRVVVPKYAMMPRHLDLLRKARDECVRRASVPATWKHRGSMLADVRAAYGPRAEPLTTRLAKRLQGETVPAVSGQRWMDFIDVDAATGESAHNLAKARSGCATLHTIHAVYDEVRATSGGKKRLCLISDHDDAGKVWTWTAYEWKGRMGTGSGHDGIYVLL